MRFPRPRAFSYSVVIAVSIMMLLTVLSVHDSEDQLEESAKVQAGSSVTFTIGMVGYGGMATLNPFVYTEAQEYQTIWPVYSKMLTYDVNGNLIGDLANSWTVSTDGRTWDFRMADNIYFCDPTSPTAKIHKLTYLDVQWTYWEVNNDIENHLSFYFNDGNSGLIQSINRGADDYEVIIVTTKPYAPFLGALAEIPIMPEYIWAHLHGGKTPMTYPNMPMVGSGPFYSTMTSVPMTSGTLLKSPIWFQENNHGWQIQIDALQYKNELSPATAWTDLTTSPSNIDVMMGVTPSQYKDNLINATTPWVKGFAPATGFVFEYQLNQLTPFERQTLLDAGKILSGGSNNPLISNPTVMLALQMSIDRQEFIDQTCLGLGDVTDSIIPKISTWYNPEPNPLTFNPTAARQLLTEAGWAWDSNGNPATSGTVPLYKKGPVNNTVYHGLSFRLLSLTPGAEWDIGSRLIVNWSREAGVEYTRELTTTNQANGVWHKGDYDAWLWDWFFSPRCDPSLDCLSVHTTGAIGTWSGSYWSNATYDALYNQSLEAVDESARRAVVNEMQAMLYDSHMVSYPAERKELYAVNYERWDLASFGNWEEQYSLMPDQGLPWLYMQLSPSPPSVAPLPAFVGDMGELIFFTATATDVHGHTLQYTWDFGDDSGLQVGQSVSHVYVEAGNFTCVVYVDDFTGLPGHNVSMSAPVTILLLFSLQLGQGWNLVSIPLLNNTLNASSLGLVAGDGVVGWDPLTQSYDLSYIEGFPTGDFALRPSTAYWIYVSTPKSIDLTGILISSRQTMEIPLDSGGWGAVAMSSLNITRHASDIVKNCTGASVEGVAMWDADSQAYVTFMPMFPSTDFALVPGQGYWVFADGAVTFAYDP